MKKILLFLILCTYVSLMYAQNTTLLEKPEPSFPVDLTPFCNEEVKKLDNINNLVQQGFRQFSRGHIQYGIDQVKFHFSSYQTKIKELRALAPNMFKDRKQLKALYNAAFPIFLEQFKRMTPKEQQAYIDELKKGIAYTKSFDLEKEKADLARATKERKRFYDEKGTLNAFIYRRLANNEISKKEGLYWLKKMKKDLSPHISKKNQPKEEYYLKSMGGDPERFAKGRIFGTDKVAVFEKKGEKYQLIPLEEDLRYHYKGHGLDEGVWSLFETAEGKYKIYLFREDKAPLDLGLVSTKPNINSLKFTEFPQQNAWATGSYGKGITTIYAINKEGKLEKNTLPDQAEDIPLDENHPKARLFLFQFKSGERKLIYNKNIKGLDALTTSTQKIYRRDNTTYQQDYWIVDDQNKLYSYYSSRKIKLLEYGPKEAIKSIEVVDKNRTIIKYQTGHADLYLFDRKRNIKEVSLPKGLDIADVKDAWRIQKKGTVLLCYYITLENGLMGVIDQNGKIILTPEYKSITVRDGMAHIKKAGKWGLADKNGKVVLPPAYESIKVNSEGFLIEKSGKWGQLDKNGKVVLPPAYESITVNSEGFLIEKSGKWGQLDKNGKTVIAPKYQELSHVRIDSKDKNTYYKFRLDEELGLMDESEKVYFKGAYSNFRVFKVAPKDTEYYFFFNAAKTGQVGVMDKNGKVLIKPVYEKLTPFRINPDDTRFYAYFNRDKNGLTGLIDGNGKVIIPAKYSKITQLEQRPSPFAAKVFYPEKQRSDLFIVTTKDDKKGIFDLNGRVRVAAEYSSLEHVPSKQPLFIFQKTAEGKKGLVDLNGKVLPGAEYHSLRYNMKNDGTALFVYQKEAKQNFGVMDKNGKEIHPEIFTSLKPVDWIDRQENKGKLSINLATLESDKGKTYLYSDKFERILDSSLDALQHVDTIVTFDPETFEEFLEVVYHPYYLFEISADYQSFKVKTKGKVSLVNFKGEVVLPPVWDQITWYHSLNYFMVREGKNWGLVNRSNKLMIPTNNEAIVPCSEPFGGYYILEQQKNSYNIADSTGKRILSKTYSEILTYKNIPLIFVGKKQADEGMKYALYSKEGKALTGFEFSTTLDTLVTFDPETFEEIVNVVPGGLIVSKNEKTYNAKKKTICLLRDEKEVIYNFEGKEVD